ncbi:MAG: serine/threonine-protein kinase [Kofleriaceae bacterium]
MPREPNSTPSRRRLGRYEVLQRLAAGGMGSIYLGRTRTVGEVEQHVVLKLMAKGLRGDQLAVDMFLDEARLLATITHQHVAQIVEVGLDGDRHFLALEYVHGRDLRAVLRRAEERGVRLPLEFGVAVIAAAAAGLHHAHERPDDRGQPRGIVHRDVCPSNLMLSYDGATKVIDFGIARATDRAFKSGTGAIKGKFGYCSPELCRGQPSDRRADVFALGVVLYELTTQRRCFDGKSDFDTLERVVEGRYLRPSQVVPDYPPALEAIVARALAIDPGDRYPTAAALGLALEELAEAERWSLTTVTLARVMRDLFGVVPEPWASEQAPTAAPAEIAAEPAGRVDDLRVAAPAGAFVDEITRARTPSRLPQLVLDEPVRDDTPVAPVVRFGPPTVPPPVGAATAAPPPGAGATAARARDGSTPPPRAPAAPAPASPPPVRPGRGRAIGVWVAAAVVVVGAVAIALLA